MKNGKKSFLLKAILILLFTGFQFFYTTTYAKEIYIPGALGNVNSETNQWSYTRSKQSDNFIVFWESGFGTNPQTATDSKYRVNVDALLKLADTCFDFYTDSLKFINRSTSKTNKYKMIIRLYYTTTWKAEGSGMDDIIGLLSLSANAAQGLGVTLAHEVGHCFQYQVYCDKRSGGWRYGLGNNGAGGNCFWEQCAQWQAFKNFPKQQFTDYNYGNYLNTAHQHILHESPRYANYFIHDFWTEKHGMDFIGRLWNESRFPEDPVDAYKRITGITQAQFNDEIFDCAARFATWDITAIRAYGESTIDSRAQCRMKAQEDDYWLVEAANCIENYGYNVIKLNAPSKATLVSACFEGKAGIAGYRNINKSRAGWRFGFVALQKDGSRVYSTMYTADDKNPADTVHFDCPDACSKLYFVVTGAPSTHWHHEWDDNAANDEQWPYQVKFENTNLHGIYTIDPDAIPANDTLKYTIYQEAYKGSESDSYPSTPVQPDLEQICKAFCLQYTDIQKQFGSSITYNAVNPNGTLNPNSTAIAPGHWFASNGTVTNWGGSAYIFSELKMNNLTFNIGQYPNRCKTGDKFSIRQALVYKPKTGNTVRVVFEFNIIIGTKSSIDHPVITPASPVINTVVSGILHLRTHCPVVTVRNMTGCVVKQDFNTDQVELSRLTAGIYLVSANGVTVRIYKQ